MTRILIVDDDRDIAENLGIILEANGYDVVAKYDTDNLVDFIAEHGPDLILLDIVFPDDAQAGFKAARALAGDERVNQIPVLVLSAVNQLSNLGFSFTEKDISDDFLPVGGFMEKPIEPDKLLARINDILKM